MRTRILHNSPGLCTCIEQLDLSLSQPQLRHVRNLAEARLVCDSTQTWAEWQRPFVERVEVSNIADTLRIAPGTAQDVRQPVGVFLVQAAVAQARPAGRLDDLCVSLDDSIARKHKPTRHLEPADWHFEHVESTPYKPGQVNGLAELGCNVWIGGWPIPFEVRLSLREKTVRRINRQREPAERIGFLSKNHLARHRRGALQPRLPSDLPV